MADKKISALTGASTPLAGTEVLPIVQSGATVKVSAANITAGRAVSVASLSAVGSGAGGTQTLATFNAAADAFSNSVELALEPLISGQSRTGIGAQREGVGTGAAVYLKAGGNEVLRGTVAGNISVATGNLVFGANGKGIVTNTAGQITQDAFSGFTSGVAKVISPAKSSGFMVYVTGYSLLGGYSAILNYGDTILVVSELNTTGGVVAFTSVSNQLNVTTTGTASQIFQELWVSVIGK
jgi:hypothetical protein